MTGSGSLTENPRVPDEDCGGVILCGGRSQRMGHDKARLRFLIEEIGAERFRELYEGELASLREEGLEVPAVRPRTAPASGADLLNSKWNMPMPSAWAALPAPTDTTMSTARRSPHSRSINPAELWAFVYHRLRP